MEFTPRRGAGRKDLSPITQAEIFGGFSPTTEEIVRSSDIRNSPFSKSSSGLRSDQTLFDMSIERSRSRVNAFARRSEDLRRFILRETERLVYSKYSNPVPNSMRRRLQNMNLI